MAKSKSQRRKGIDRGTPRRSGTFLPAISSLQGEWLAGALLVTAIVTVFSPVWWAEYLWDDGMFVTGNPVLINAGGLVEIWTTKAADVCPLTLTFLRFIHPLFGVAPLPYHLITVLLHAAAAILLWRVLSALRVPGAWLGAMLWAIHPVNVESVAWVAETKNTLSGLFFFLSTLFYMKILRSENSGRRGFDANYAWAWLFAAAAMAAKSSTVILPLVLALCAWWIDGRWQWRRLLGLAPLFAFAVAAGFASMWTQHLQQIDVANVQWQRSWPERFATAGDAVWFYLGKLAVPYPLMMIYPRWQIDPASIVTWLPLLAAFALMMVFWLKRGSWARPWFFAYAYFLIALLPVAGLLDNYFSQFSFVADHFQYLASVGPLALAGAGLARCAGFFPAQRWLPAAAGAFFIVILGVVSWNRAWAFENEEILWSDNLGKNPACWVAANNLGNAYFKNGDPTRAVVLYQKALELRPDYAEAESNLGDAAYQAGDIDGALAHYRRALQMNPRDADASYNVAYVALQRHQYDQALAGLKATLAIDPQYVRAYYNIGNILLDEKQADDAIAEFEKAIAIKPDYSDARNNLAVALAQLGRLDEARAQVAEILRYDPNNPEALQNERLLQGGR